LNPERLVTPSVLKNVVRLARCAFVFDAGTPGLVNPHSTAASRMSSREMSSAAEGPRPESSKSIAMVLEGEERGGRARAARSVVARGAHAKLGDAAEAPPRGDDRESPDASSPSISRPEFRSAPRRVEREDSRDETCVSVAGFFFVFESVFGRRKLLLRL
jgi:hypothetical protein